MDDIYARFNPNPTKIAAWSQLLMLGSAPNSAPDVLYTRAIPIFLHWRDNLIKLGWRNVPDEQLPSGLLFVVESHRHSPARADAFASGKAAALGLSPSSSSDSICETLSSHQRTLRPTEVTRFALPAELSAFLEYGEDIQESFRNPLLFNPVLDPRNNLVLATPHQLDQQSTFRDIFYLLQLIVPGMFLLVHDALSFSEQKRSSSLLMPPLGSQRNQQRPLVPRGISPNPPCGSVESRASPRIMMSRTRRALPPAEWMMSKTEALEGIFGKSLLHELISCARDVELTVWSTVNGPDGDPLDSGSDAGFEPPMSPAGSWSDPEEVSGSIAIPSASHTRRYQDRYFRRAYSL